MVQFLITALHFSVSSLLSMNIKVCSLAACLFIVCQPSVTSTHEKSHIDCANVNLHYQFRPSSKTSFINNTLYQMFAFLDRCKFSDNSFTCSQSSHGLLQWHDAATFPTQGSLLEDLDIINMLFMDYSLGLAGLKFSQQGPFPVHAWLRAGE